MASAETAKSPPAGGTAPFDWATAVRPLLGATYGNFQSSDLVKLAKCIETSGDQIMRHDPEFEQFYSLFAGLATHHLCANSSSIPKASLPTVVNACRVLAEFILNRLEKPHPHCSVMPKQFVLLVKSLCKGLGFLQRSDVITLAALLKSSQLPPHIRATIGAEKLSEDEGLAGKIVRKKDRGPAVPATTEATSPTARANAAISTLIDFFSMTVPPDSVVEKAKESSKPTTPTDASKDVKDQFVSECMQHLMRLNAGSILIDVCLNLPFLARYNLMYRDIMRGEDPFGNMNPNECQSIFDSYSSFLNDVVMVSRVVVLPLFEPLTPDRLTKLCSLGCTCLLAACTVVIAYHIYAPKSDADTGSAQELEAFMNNVVEKSLVIFSTILSNIQLSQNIGGPQLQNMRALGAWCIASALNHMLRAFDMNGAVLCIAQQFLTLLQPLLSDLKSDTGKTDSMAELTVNSVLTPWQRFECINKRCKIVPVLLRVAHDSFLRSVEIMRESRTSIKPVTSEAIGASKQRDFDSETETTQVQSVPNTPSESDSEPLLGSWLEELLSSVPQLVDSAVKQSAGILHSGLRRRTTATSESSSILGVKEDAHTYMSLSINCLRMLNDDLLYGYRTDLLKKSVSSCWTEREVGYLATLIRTVDRQLETGNSADDSLVEFKTTLTKFVHNLIANGLLGESLEVCLLAKLDIALGKEETEFEWPLNLSACLSGILCQMLLLRQNKERDESGHSETGETIVRIWTRFLAALKKNSFKDHDYIDIVDVNIEHLQVQLALFHSLPLMQKKTVLLDVCKTIKEVVQENRKTRRLNNNASSHFTRILLIFDYMLRYFYEPPPALVHHIKLNVFPIQSQMEVGDVLMMSMPSGRTIPNHFLFPEIEDVYRSEVPILQQVKVEPLFYNLTPNVSNDELPKLDGLAATFIQNSPIYNELYDCCCDLISFYDRVRVSNDQAGAFHRAVLRYSCALTWRIVKLLPPSVRFLEEVVSWSPETVSAIPAAKSRMFMLANGNRLTEAAFVAWMKDGLIKQGRTADQADELVRKVSAKTSDAALILALVGQEVRSMKSKWTVDVTDSNVNEFPSFMDMIYIDLALCKSFALLDSAHRSDNGKTKIPANMIPIQTFKGILVDVITAARSLVIERAIRSPSEPFPSTPVARKAALKLMSLCGAHPDPISVLATASWDYAHPSLKAAVEFWNRRSLHEFPTSGSWRNEFAQDFAPIDTYLGSVYMAHIGGLSNEWLACQLITVKRVLHTSFHLLADTVSWYPNAMEKKEVEQLMAPIILDVLASNLSDFAFAVLSNYSIEKQEADLLTSSYTMALPIAYELVVDSSLSNSGAFDPIVSEKCLAMMEASLEISDGRAALVYVLTSVGSVSNLLRAAVQPEASLGFTTALVRLLGKIFQTTETVQDKSFIEFCHSVSKSFSFEPQLLQQLLNRVFVVKDESDVSSAGRVAVMTECCNFLDAVARSANRALSCDSIEISRLLLETMIPVMTAVLKMDYRSLPISESGSRGAFSQLFATASRFASVGRGLSHCDLLKAANEWITLCTDRMSKSEALAQIKSGDANPTLRVLSEAMSTIIQYLNELTNLFNQRQSELSAITYDSDASGAEPEMEGIEELTTQAEEDDSAGDESEDDALDSKLCTFIVTQKEFMNQHWYHCHTCGMIDGEGVCTICAKVCHKGHDLSYSKYGSFFCDCGAKSEPSCQALVKRTKFKATTKTAPVAPGDIAAEVSVPGVRQSQSKGQSRSKADVDVQKSIEEQKKLVLFFGDARDRDELRKELTAAKNEIVKSLLKFLTTLMPAVTAAAESNSSIGNLSQLRQSLKELQECEEFRCETVESLAALTGGSQENAFENVNVKLSFSGDQGQTIKQLLMNHVLHRTCLACASSQNKKKQYLAVVHDRCKVAIMQLSSFLKQIENGKKKPTLSRSASDSFPFTILSVSENPICEDYVAICGLKECVIVTLSPAGAISDRLTLPLGLDVGNFVIKALWLPGSTTEIALVTADFVRIFDLAKSSTRPEYDFLLPAGKIRDATFICRDVKGKTEQTMERYLLMMTSSGYIYTQSLGDHCHNAIHGSFYVTDVLEVRHDELEETNGNLAGGGVSIYYSHSLQLLFISYTSGKNLFCSLTQSPSGVGAVKKLQFITWKSGQKSVSSQALYRWNESYGHGGLLVALTHASQSPVVLFIRPRSILVQEVTLPPKAKVLDAVLCRNGGPLEEAQSSVLLLCEDGSVRTVGILKEMTGYWMKKPSSFRFPVVQTPYRVRSKRTWKSDRTETSDFPVDFFEQCQQLMDIEFGGSDLLQIYNVLQLRNRLQTSNLYVVSAKTDGFQLEVLNRESGMVMCGVRIELGKHSLEKSPTYVEVFGRRKNIALTHGRWLDLPFTKDESISAGQKLVITFGSTADPSGMCFVDSVKVYGKSKEVFGWPDDVDEELPLPLPSETRALTAQVSSVASEDQQQQPTRVQSTVRDIGEFERAIKCAFETLAATFLTFGDLTEYHGQATGLAVNVLTTSTHPDTVRSAKTVLRLLSTSKADYYANKDSFILKHVIAGLKRTEATSDPELFAFLISLVRSIAVNRPNSLTSVTGGGTNDSLLTLLPESFWYLRNLVSPWPAISSVGSVELENVDGLVRAIVDILHAHCVADISLTSRVVKALMKFLLCENIQIAIACRQAICWIYRRKLKKKRVAPISTNIKSPLPPKIPNPILPSLSPLGPVLNPHHQPSQPQAPPEPPPFVLMGDEPMHPIPANALLVEDDTDGEPDAEGVDQVYEIHADGDEEAMMELAIALSLQDQANAGAVHGVPNAADNNAYQPASVQESIDGGHLSDTTGSGLSDEEGSTAATEGSTLRVSPSEERPPMETTTTGAASDTGGSSGSGRSSNDGESAPSVPSRMQGSTSGLQPLQSSETDGENKNKHHKLLLTFLDCLIDAMPELDNLNGIHCISYMQVLTSLLNSFDCTDGAERKMVMKLLDSILAGLDFSPEAAVAFCRRSPRSEVTLLKLRFITVLLSRSKGRTRQQMSEADAFICSYTAGSLVKRGVLDYCLGILKTLLQQVQPAESMVSSSKVLELRPDSSPPDLAPFFLRPYVKEHSRDVFESYTQLVTEMAMRLPYQVKKVADMCRDVIPPLHFEAAWSSVLCEFLRSEQPSFVKKHIRKLFMFICGSKEKYRQMRDVHSLEFDLKAVQALCSPVESSVGRQVTLDYGTLNVVMDHLKSCCDVALNRAGNWQKFCVTNTEMFCYLLQLSVMVDDNIASVILTLLNAAVTLPDGKEPKKKPESRREEADKFRFSEKHAAMLADLLLNEKRLPLLITVLKRYLFECNTTDRRWQMHGFVKALFGCTENNGQQRLLDILWQDLWPDVPHHGRKAVQFVDLLGYFTLTLASPQRIAGYATNVLALLKSQNQMLSQHTNANVYNALASLLEFDGYYLESNPCLVCNNPEIPMTNLKLSSIKMDARFTTSSQILKLVGSHEISKITLKISEIRRTKMVKRLSLFYSNKTVQSAVELKNRPDLWTLAKRFTLAQNQQELKMEFAVPIVACNLIMDYSEFYETPLTASEMMHCPRCSASVPAHPGVCNNCGENVYQCHKCRAINYDERDPFLCNACGYSKYGKFDYTITARPVAGVEPIENEEDRKKVCNLINSLLEKADQIYRQLQVSRQQIEAALARISGQDLSADDPSTTSPLTVSAATGQLASTGAMTFVTKNIQQVAIKYNRDCRTAFDELSKVVQKIIANRAELVEYDRRMRETLGLPPGTEKLRVLQSSPKCFGCAAASAQQCILLIRGMTSSAAATTKLITSQKELMKELIDVAVKQSSARARQAARELVCSIINDQEEATDMVCNHITEKVTRALSEPNWSTAVVTSLVQVELHLLSASLQLMDKCWERRLRCALDLFMKSTASPSSAVVEAITMPLLQMLHSIIYPPPFLSERMKGKSIADAASVEPVLSNVGVTMVPWLQNTPGNLDAEKTQAYNEWLKNRKPRIEQKRTLMTTESAIAKEESWLERALFCPNSVQLRETAAAIFRQICATAPLRKALVLDLLTRHLKQISEMGDRAHEFVTLYQSLLDEEQWKVYVAVHNVLPKISALLLKEMETLSALESNTLATDIAQGYTIKVLTDMLISIMEIEKIRKRYKSQLLSPVLHSYLAVRSIVVQRTKLIDDAQAKLLELLELLTTGTESETKEFMVICVETVKKCPPDDVRTPVFIFERLCSIIYPEEKEVGEFLINIEKDPAQEDFLQGRMAGNPYHSSDAGMGPLMRDIKNRICRDCELFSLLEDDTGMELLVSGKIMSLDLPVVEVYKKVWQPQHNGEAMLVVYRMRGLLGDATEEFVETLAPKKGEKINEEEVFRLSGIMSECGGIEVMLDRLTAVKNVLHASPLLSVLLSLFEHCVKVKRNRLKLLEPGLNAVSKFLACLRLILSMKDPTLVPFAEKIFSILDRILTEANELPEAQFSALFGTKETDKDFEYLLNLVSDDQSVFVGSVKEALLRTLPNLSLGSETRMKMLIDYFVPYVNFDVYDLDPTPKASSALDSLCALTKGVVQSKYGHELKQRFIIAAFLDAAMKYLLEHCPPLFKIGLTIDSPDWKEFLSRPSLKYVLRLLAGLAKGHEPSQSAIAKECIPIIHRLEQVSSEEHLGTLAETLMEALRENPSVAKRIIEVREETRAKKKQMAMAMRQKQLGEMGMKIGDKGLVRVESGVLKDADLREETGLVCSICQDGYTAAPQKVLGIYTYTKRVNAEDYDTKARKTPAYSTVSHFNIIHVECHQTAVRSARGREEWDSAMLHNANTRCNGLLPLWGPNVSESEYAGHLSRHNQYIQESTGITDVGFTTAVHDLKLLLNRFAQEKSFADESGGGGRSSNIHLIPYLTQLALYVMISSNQNQSHVKALHTYFAQRPSDWVGLAYESDGHLYYCVLTFLMSPQSEWQRRRVDLLKRMLVTAQARQVARGGASKSLPDTGVKDYVVYKPYLLFVALVNGFYKYLYSEVKCDNVTEWPAALQTFIRQNDAKLLETTTKLLKHFEEELLPCESFSEILDVCGFLADIPNPDEFLASTLSSVA